MHGEQVIYNGSPMETHFQLVAEKDLSRTIELMREFYEHESITFDEEVARSGLRKTLLDSSLGSAYLILAGEQAVGYFVLTFCFSLEFHGKFALLDEIYIRKPFRRHKLGAAVIEFAQGICKKMGMKALRLEVGQPNEAAHGLYRNQGFKQEMRYLFTKWL
jgi:ribosomal protein S18 acetylase RimI-like enzyme